MKTDRRKYELLSTIGWLKQQIAILGQTPVPSPALVGNNSSRLPGPRTATGL